MNSMPRFQADECFLVSPRDTGDYSRIYGFVFLPVFDMGNQPWIPNDNERIDVGRSELHPNATSGPATAFRMPTQPQEV